MDGEKREDGSKDIQWHPAFVSAMNLELAADRGELVFEREYNLNTRIRQLHMPAFIRLTPKRWTG